MNMYIPFLSQNYSVKRIRKLQIDRYIDQALRSFSVFKYWPSVNMEINTYPASWIGTYT